TTDAVRDAPERTQHLQTDTVRLIDCLLSTARIELVVFCQATLEDTSVHVARSDPRRRARMQIGWGSRRQTIRNHIRWAWRKVVRPQIHGRRRSEEAGHGRGKQRIDCVAGERFKAARNL